MFRPRWAPTDIVWQDARLGNDLSSMHVSVLGRRESVWQAHVVPTGVESDVSGAPPGARVTEPPTEPPGSEVNPTRMETTR
ncbi:hypothetical protein GCM10009740_09090 [Terrabacter terrae]|uniref:Uncharacterized protein n=1 Tax=Terrabacter terrae TaxID=318434 RepID=A0ABP5FCS9_9MICO